MNANVPRATLLCACLLLLAGLSAHAQNKGPGGPPPGSHTPGTPGGPGGPPANGGPGNQPGGLGTSVVSRGGMQFGPPGRWWDDKSVTHAVGLRQDQQRKMDSIFDANKSAILNSYRSLLSEQTKLDALNKQSQPDSRQVLATIDAVNQARASLEKATTEMLLQIRSQMDSSQIQKLQSLH